MIIIFKIVLCNRDLDLKIDFKKRLQFLFIYRFPKKQIKGRFEIYI